MHSYPIADDTWVVGEAVHAAGTDLTLHRNSLLIRGAEPVLVDTGAASAGQGWLDATWALVDPVDVRWVVVTHDEPDHTGNLAAVLAACPQATVVALPATVQRLFGRHPGARTRALAHGQRLDVGDRTLRLLPPAVYDAAATAAVLDERTGTLFAADAFGLPVRRDAHDARDVPLAEFEEGLAAYHRALAPWLALVETARWEAGLEDAAALAVVSAHGPALTGARLDQARGLLRRLPDLARAGDGQLDGDVAALLAALVR